LYDVGSCRLRLDPIPASSGEGERRSAPVGRAGAEPWPAPLDVTATRQDFPSLQQQIHDTPVVHVPDPDALAAEFSSRSVELFRPLEDDDDGLRGFEVQDADGYVLFSAALGDERYWLSSTFSVHGRDVVTWR
jgi:hypothetical protein